MTHPAHEPPGHAFEFRRLLLGNRLVDFDAHRIAYGGAELRIRPKSMAVLCALVAAKGEPVSREQLLDRVWPETCPTDEVITQAIVELRRALDRSSNPLCWIDTIPRVGYRLVGEVRASNDEDSDHPSILADAASAAAEVRVSVQPGAQEEAQKSAQWPLRTLWLTGAVGISLLAVVAVHSRVGPGPGSLATSPISSPVVTWLTSKPEREMYPSLSPDGSQFAYTESSASGGRSRIVVRDVDDAASLRIFSHPPPGHYDTYPAWSPRGDAIAFMRGARNSCAILLKSLSGNERKLIDCGANVLTYLEWHPDGRRLLTLRKPADPGVCTMIHLVDVETGESSALPYTPLPIGRCDVEARISPDARWIVFRRGRAPNSDLWLVPAVGGTARLLAPLDAEIRGFDWRDDSASLLASSDHEGARALYLVSLNGDVEQVSKEALLFPRTATSVKLAAAHVEQRLVRIRAAPADGNVVPTAASRSDFMPRPAPHGSRLAFVSQRSGSDEIWLHEAGLPAPRQLTSMGSGRFDSLEWSSDAQHLVAVNRGLTGRMHIIDATTGESRALTGEDQKVRFASFGRDGRFIYYSSNRGSRWRIWRMRIDGSGAESLYDVDAIDPREAIDGALFYVKESAVGLHRLDLQSFEERQLTTEVWLHNIGEYTVHEDAVRFVALSSRGKQQLMFQSWRGRNELDEPQPVAVEFKDPLTAGELVLAADQQRWYYTVIEHESTDIALVRW